MIRYCFSMVLLQDILLNGIRCVYIILSNPTILPLILPFHLQNQIKWSYWALAPMETIQGNSPSEGFKTHWRVFWWVSWIWIEAQFSSFFLQHSLPRHVHISTFTQVHHTAKPGYKLHLSGGHACSSLTSLRSCWWLAAAVTAAAGHNGWCSTAPQGEGQVNETTDPACCTCNLLPSEGHTGKTHIPLTAFSEVYLITVNLICYWHDLR